MGAAPGPPLGAGVTHYERHAIDVPEDATLVLYTDGLIEDRSRSIDVGLQALRDALRDVRLSPGAVCDHVLRELQRADGGEDDIALLVMKHSALTAPSSRPARPELCSHRRRPRHTRASSSPGQVVVGAQLEPALARERHRQPQPAARFALDLDAPARRRGPDVPLPVARPRDRARERRGERDRLAVRPRDHRRR